MVNSSIIKTPGTYDEIDIRCPNCNSNQVTVYTNYQGYYEVINCHNCNFKREPDLI